MRHYEPVGVLIGRLPRRIIAEIRCGLPQVDNAHTSKATRTALAARAHWLSVAWLPEYAPELNDIEPLRRDLKRHHLAHLTFTGPEALDHAIHDAVATLNAERHHHALASQPIAA
jgi:transposase